MSWRSRLILVSLVSGVSVGIVYLVQPLLPLIARDFSVGTTVATVAATMFLVGYAVGVLSLIALSDRIQARTQVQLQALAVAGFLLLGAFAPTFGVLCIAAFGAGVFTTIGQVLLAAMVRASAPGATGSTTSVLAGAFLIGIFGSRILAGIIGSAVGWRPVLAGAAVIMLLGIPPLRRATPTREIDRSLNYWSILRSLPRLAASNSVLRVATTIQFFSFAGFQALWSLITLHLVAQPLAWSVAGAGMIGIVGIAAGGASIAVGRVVDRRGSVVILGWALALLLVSSVTVALFPELPIPLIIAFFGLTLGLQVVQVVTQSRALRSAGQTDTGRSNSVYMFGAFVGGSAGTAVGGFIYGGGDYRLVAVFAVATTIVASGFQILRGRRLFAW